MFVRTDVVLKEAMCSNKECIFVRSRLGLKRNLWSNVVSMFLRPDLGLKWDVVDFESEMQNESSKHVLE